MSDNTDLSVLSDEELKAIIAGADLSKAEPGRGMEAMGAKRAAYSELQDRAPKPIAEEIEPSAWRRGMAAFGGALTEPALGLKEKFELAFPGGNGEATRARIAADRTERRGIQRQLEETTAGQFGGFMGKAAPFALAGPTAGGQSAMAAGLGFLEGGPDTPKGLGSELASSAFKGGVDAITTGALTKGAQLGTKAVSGAMGRYTPDGQRAMELDASAKRLGLPSPSIGQLDPLAPEALRAHPEMAVQQAQALQARMAGSKAVPDPSGGQMSQEIPGGVLKEGMREAVSARKAQADEMYKAVDDYVSANNLQPVAPLFTLRTLAGVAKNPQFNKKPGQSADLNKVFQLLDGENPAAFQWLKQAGSPKAAQAQGMSFAQYKEMRQTVGAVLEDLRATSPKDRKSWHNTAINELNDLKSALDNDVTRWGNQNSNNPEAIELYKRANDFYRDVAAPATKSDVAVKSALPIGHKRGWAGPEGMYASVTNPLNRSLVERLLPTASRETSDMLNVLQNLPDVGAVVAKGSVPTGGASRELGALARAALGHPGLALLETAPGARWLSTTRPAKGAYFGRGYGKGAAHAVGPALQYPAGGLEQWSEGISATDR
jgi:hypothetical protein